MSTLTVEVKIIKELCRNADFRVFGCSPMKKYNELQLNDYYNFTIKGDLPFLSVGEEYTLEIEEVPNSKYKGTYQVVSVPSMQIESFRDLTKDESFDILMNITTSKRLANNILDAYPNFIELILTEGKEAIDLSKIKGVGEVYLSAYERELNNKYKYYSLLQKLKDYKINFTDCKKMFEAYKKEEDILKEMENNPYYMLTEISKRSFDDSDKKILNVHPELHDSEIRCEALIMDILNRNEIDCNTRINANLVWQICKEEYNAPQEWVKVIKKIVTESPLIHYDDETKYMSKMSTYLAECQINDFVKDKLNNSSKLDIDVEKYRDLGEYSMTDKQLECLSNFCKSGISILAGSAGSGKTSSVKGLINLLDDNKMTYTLLSPTGKASRVLSESTNRTAMTIHKRCYQGAINSDVIVLDECTMIGLDIFVMLLDKIVNENCRIVLVGDPAQLSSISLGKVFTDLLNANIIPTTELTEIFRYKSNGSLFTATNIRQGKQFFDDTEMVKHNEENKTYSIGNNYKFIEAIDEESADIFVNEYLKLIKKGIKPKDIMGLSPFNVKELGAYTLNNMIQEEINPPKPNENYLERQIRASNETYNIVFREKDMVMNTKNDYDVTTYEGYLKIKDDESGKLSSADVEKTSIMNGQIGTILKIEQNGLLIEFDEEIVFYEKFKLSNLLLAYVCSVHKSQGSSVDNVIAIVGEQHKKMLSRGLLYVADTRCRKTCINIGSINAFNSALDIVDNKLRDTWLYELLIEQEEGEENVKY